MVSGKCTVYCNWNKIVDKINEWTNFCVCVCLMHISLSVIHISKCLVAQFYAYFGIF